MLFLMPSLSEKRDLTVLLQTNRISNTISEPTVDEKKVGAKGEQHPLWIYILPTL